MTVLTVVGNRPGLLGWGDEGVQAAVEQLRAAELDVVASPTYKATYTGLLTCLLDSAYDEAALEPWLGRARGQVAAARAGLR